MKKVYESPTMVVHDDREPLTAEQAFDILWSGADGPRRLTRSSPAVDDVFHANQAW